MPFNAMQGGLTSAIGNIPYATDNIPHATGLPMATGNIPHAPTGDRTPNSGFKDPRDGHFTIRADSYALSLGTIDIPGSY